ncbi:hypothetical protein K402DRAFT_386033 [Aulographum hederae CBS 113979]|uniref:Uncharacterized protein n=1 Tax=Aulographum hederae CBS 113979 TaxID=1176131 RepID=A0A6G1GL52_9PEZI|nr:hypothetical protein K402DRAFT_386033 [Aulographum hederae CBS 113979]
MAAALASIGLAADVLGIASFFQSNLPADDPTGATIQIKAGLGDGESSNLGGTIDHVYAYDINNKFLGQSGSCKIGNAGGFCKVSIDQNDKGVQADFVSVANGNDATCIAWVSVTQLDERPGGAWTGDVGSACGVDWYYGNQLAGTINNGDWRPRCAWIDGDHTNDFKFAAMKFRVRAYGELSQSTLDENRDCSSTIMGADNGPINDAPAKAKKTKRGGSLAAKPKKRATKARLAWMKNRLVQSSFDQHSAETLCNSETSWGPDFIGADGKFCDMETHTLHDVCDGTGNATGCVVVGPTNSTAVVARSLGQTLKTYDVISSWK